MDLKQAQRNATTVTLPTEMGVKVTAPLLKQVGCVLVVVPPLWTYALNVLLVTTRMMLQTPHCESQDVVMDLKQAQRNAMTVILLMEMDVKAIALLLKRVGYVKVVVRLQ